MPTVSCDPAHRDDCWRGAKFLGTLLESLGACSRWRPANWSLQDLTVLRAVIASPARHVFCVASSQNGRHSSRN